MMTIEIRPRRVWTEGLGPSGGKDPAWRTGGTVRRPVAHNPCRYLAVHFAGNADNQKPGNQFLSLDPLQYMRNMFSWAHSSAGNKGDEYPYVLAGREGVAFEWSGRYVSAHCTYWNTAAKAVQLGLDVDDDVPEAMVTNLLELRRFLVADNQLTPDHWIGPHYELLGTQPPGGPLQDGHLVKDTPIGPWPKGGPSDKRTTCWGTRAELHRQALCVPLTTTPPEPDPKPIPPPPVGEDSTMIVIVAPKGTNARFLATSDGKGFVSSMTWIAEEARAKRLAAYYPEQVVDVASCRDIGLIGPVPHGDTLRDWTIDDFLNAS